MSQAASAPVADTASPAQQVTATATATGTDGGQSATSTTTTERDVTPREPRELGSTESIMDALADMDGDHAGSGQDGQDGEPGPEAPETAQGSETPPAEVPEAPSSWTPEEKAMFGQLPPELQQTVIRRETERERFVHTKAQETAQARHQLGQLTQWAEQQMGQSLQAAQMVLEGEYAGIDWLGLQKSDPAIFLQLDADRRERYAAIQRLAAQHQQIAEFGRVQAVQAEAAHLHAEADAAMPQLAAVMGKDVDKAAVRKDVVAYLQHLGAPPEHINGLTHAYQLTMAVKAMLWDKAAHTRAEAAKKVAAAPQMQKTGRAPVSDSGDRDPGRARDALKRHGSSTENVANALKHLGF